MSPTFLPLETWGFPIHRFFVAAGPCSAESEDQVLEAASALAGTGISFFRAGIWKPRTHPGHFEGVGAEGLRWLQRVKQEWGLAVGVEVATPQHVEECLRNGVDLVWVGARTTPNPFAVQALADSLKDTGLPVLVKNPISPDLELWMGAMERFLGAGLVKVGAIHRGFSSSEKDEFRFSPQWRWPIELKRRWPDLPLLCDPSHICGKRKLLYAVAQEALDLLFDGLMIEVHPNPDAALSDSSQQLTPSGFQDLIERLTPKHEESSESVQRRLKELRNEVDGVDHQLLELLSRRMSVVRRMAELKHQGNVSTFQPHRWEEIVESRVQEGVELGLSSRCVFDLLQTIHEEAIEQQKKVFKPGEDAKVEEE